MRYHPTIGLEVHAELKTRTKMFCNSANDAEANEPNTNICPICMGHPGTLPAINKEAVLHVLRVGAALKGELADFTEFDRKNYFYPDLPKGYQISQYKHPLISGGMLANVALTRIHLEEDTARSAHEHEEYSLIDFNRAGVPLMELVTEPVITSAEEASNFSRELQLLLRYLGASDANMEKGEMRVEANISVSETEETLGTKVEVKNLNSFRSVERAIHHELKRQTELLEHGKIIVQETRGWDERKEITFAQRVKEESHDYRYFPDPDLPRLQLRTNALFQAEAVFKSLPELPWERLKRYKTQYHLPQEAARVLVHNRDIGTFFDRVVADLDNQSDTEIFRRAANYLISDVAGHMRAGETILEHTNLDPTSFRDLVLLDREGAISSRGAKDLIPILLKEGGSPRKIAKDRGLLQESDTQLLESIIGEIIKEQAHVVEEYHSGKESALQFLIGQGMKKTKGSANPTVLKALLVSRLTG